MATDEDTALTIAASDLLANDQEFDGDTMEIVAVSQNAAVRGWAILSIKAIRLAISR